MPETVRLRHGLLIHGGHTGICASVAKGFYEEEGIECLISRGYGSQRTLEEVARGEVEIGEVDLSVLFLSRAEGLPVRGVGALYHKPQHALYALGPISSPADLRGKSIGVTPGDAGASLFPLFLKQVGLDVRQLTTISLLAEEKVSSLLSGKVDVLLTYAINGPAVEAGAARRGSKSRELLWAEYGFDLPSNGFVASEALLEKRPDLVRRFLRATYRGMVWALAHPDEAARLFSSCHPQIDEDLARRQWKKTIGFLLTPEAFQEGLGFIAEGRLEGALRALSPLMKGDLEGWREAYTHDYLPEKALRLPPPGTPQANLDPRGGA